MGERDRRRRNRDEKGCGCIAADALMVPSGVFESSDCLIPLGTTAGNPSAREFLHKALFSALHFPHGSATLSAQGKTAPPRSSLSTVDPNRTNNPTNLTGDRHDQSYPRLRHACSCYRQLRHQHERFCSKHSVSPTHKLVQSTSLPLPSAFRPQERFLKMELM